MQLVKLLNIFHNSKKVDTSDMNNNEFTRLIDSISECPGFILRHEFFNSAVLMPIVEIGGELHFLFEKRAMNIRQEGEICFPGGRFDPDFDSSYQDTAIRETIEELGITEDDIKISKQLGILVAPMGVAVEAFIGEIIDYDSLNLEIDLAEVEKIFTIPIEYFRKNKPTKYHVRIQVNSGYTDENGNYIELLPVKKLGLPEKYSNPWRGRKQHVLVYEGMEDTIWGITAELISEFISKLERANR
ncbi:MAG: DNA mismatch repair protein MutT [Melioribacteraceae bacterium]|nr:MAG: DNA mismatch repair protein MutT [Melioribacteraceae bacterium]